MIFPHVHINSPIVQTPLQHSSCTEQSHHGSNDGLDTSEKYELGMTLTPYDKCTSKVPDPLGETERGMTYDDTINNETCSNQPFDQETTSWSRDVNLGGLEIKATDQASNDNIVRRDSSLGAAEISKEEVFTKLIGKERKRMMAELRALRCQHTKISPDKNETSNLIRSGHRLSPLKRNTKNEMGEGSVSSPSISYLCDKRRLKPLSNVSSVSDISGCSVQKGNTPFVLEAPTDSHVHISRPPHSSTLAFISAKEKLNTLLRFEGLPKYTSLDCEPPAQPLNHPPSGTMNTSSDTKEKQRSRVSRVGLLNSVIIHDSAKQIKRLECHTSDMESDKIAEDSVAVKEVNARVMTLFEKQEEKDKIAAKREVLPSQGDVSNEDCIEGLGSALYKGPDLQTRSMGYQSPVEEHHTLTALNPTIVQHMADIFHSSFKRDLASHQPFIFDSEECNKARKAALWREFDRVQEKVRETEEIWVLTEESIYDDMAFSSEVVAPQENCQHQSDADEVWSRVSYDTVGFNKREFFKKCKKGNEEVKFTTFDRSGVPPNDTPAYLSTVDHIVESVMMNSSNKGQENGGESLSNDNYNNTLLASSDTGTEERNENSCGDDEEFSAEIKRLENILFDQEEQMQSIADAIEREIHATRSAVSIQRCYRNWKKRSMM